MTPQQSQALHDGFIATIINAMPILGSASDKIKEHIAAKENHRRVTKGTSIFSQDDRATFFYIITDGWVKLYRETIDGTQAVSDIVNKYHLIGETALFENNHYPYSAEAVEDTRVITLPLALLQQELQDNHAFAVSFIQVMANQQKIKEKEIEHRDLQSAPERIACFLLRLVDQKAHLSGRVTIHLPYDKRLIAARLGMQPETFSRALSKLKDTVQFDLNASTIVIDKIEDLVAYACHNCSASYPCKDLCKNHISVLTA